MEPGNKSQSQAADDVWPDTINRVSPAVVRLQTAITLPFGAQEPTVREGTGFIVDLEHGYILTTRYMLGGGGPAQTRAIFRSGAVECPVSVLEIDPLHDFAICQFDVAAVAGIDLTEVKLIPENVKVGLQVRVFGYGRKNLVFYPGMINRIDCNPVYWDACKSIFDDESASHLTMRTVTPYLQASSSSTFESTGSPVIDVHGNAVALATSRMPCSASEYFLPLDRPKRALQALLAQQPIMRGTIGSNWILETRAACCAKGLETETFHKFCPGGGGLLTASAILPGGSSHNLIQEADLLLELNNEVVPSLSSLENAIDKALGSSQILPCLSLHVWRQGTYHTVKIDVQDLSRLVDCQLFEYAGSTFESLSYAMAMSYRKALEGVYVSKSTTFKQTHIVMALDGRPTLKIRDFIDVVRGIPGK